MAYTAVQNTPAITLPPTGPGGATSFNPVYTQCDPTNGNYFATTNRDLVTFYLYPASSAPAWQSGTTYTAGQVINFSLSATVTAASLTSSTSLTVSSVNSFQVGDEVTVSGAAEPFVNGALAVTAATGTNFSAVISPVSYSLTATTASGGTAASLSLPEGASNYIATANFVGTSGNSVTLTVDDTTLAAPSVVGNAITIHTLGSTVSAYVASYPSVTVTAGTINFSYTGAGTDNFTTSASQSLAGGTENTTITYTGTFPAFSLAGSSITVSGFANAANNGTFTVISNTTTVLVVTTPSGVTESHTASALLVSYTNASDTGTAAISSATYIAKVNAGSNLNIHPTSTAGAAFWDAYSGASSVTLYSAPDACTQRKSDVDNYNVPLGAGSVEFLVLPSSVFTQANGQFQFQASSNLVYVYVRNL